MKELLEKNEVYVATELSVTRFGNPVLRKPCRILSVKRIATNDIQSLIQAMYAKLATDMYGVGLAAPQVGYSIALSVIGIKPTPTRPDAQRFNSVIINPVYKGIGDTVEKWEGCISCGTGDDTLYAKVPRYTTIKATWLDERAMPHTETLNGFVAHVFQHETDHVNGVLFVDKVKNTQSYMMGGEYRQRIVKKQKN